ncbi:MAG: hypothetical protein FWE27_01800, partial [Defluviitaleaceae bacterium]|nr:hypothetical protein [Defluviitaleaceae bacterium]
RQPAHEQKKITNAFAVIFFCSGVAYALAEPRPRSELPVAWALRGRGGRVACRLPMPTTRRDASSYSIVAQTATRQRITRCVPMPCADAPTLRPLTHCRNASARRHSHANVSTLRRDYSG